MLRKTLCAALGLALSSVAALAQPAALDLESLDQRLTEIVETQGVVGASVAIADAEGVIFARGYGYADQEAGLQASADTPFRAGSVSKLFTALATMRLVETGALDLATPLSEAAPEIAFTNRFETQAPVRLVHLLEHTTGWDDIQLKEYRSFPAGTTITEGLADNPVSRTSRWAPGLYASYANSGPAVMGRVIETRTGLPFEEAADALVFNPLGLASASFDQDAPEHHISSYDAEGGLTPFTRIWATPSGGLSIGARDLVEVGRMLMTGGAGYLTPETVARMERSQTSIAAEAGVPPYGIGLYHERHTNGVWTGHAGAIDTAQAEVFYDRESGLVYALMVNTAGRGMWDMKNALRDALGSGAAPVPATEESWSLPEGAEGVYRILNPRVEMNRIAEDLVSFVRVWQCERELCVKPGLFEQTRRYTPYGEGRFYKTEEPHKRIFLVPAGADQYEIVYLDGESWGRSSTLRLLSPMVMWVGTLTLLVTSLASLLVWVIGRPFGAFKTANRWRVWVWPSLSILTLASGVVALGLLTTGDAMANLSGPTLMGRVLQLGTLGFGPIALAGLWAAFKASGVGFFTRLHAGLTSAFLTLTWAWMALYGWAGLTPWSYSPTLMG